MKTIEAAYYDQEYIRIVEEILDHREFQTMDTWIQHISTRRLSHCINVSYISYRIAKKLKVDAPSCARAGLLHDFCLYDFHDDLYKHTKQLINHPKEAAKTAKERFNMSDKEVRAIRTHMFPLGPFPNSWTGWIIQFADKVCAIAEFFDGIGALRRAKHGKSRRYEDLATYIKKKKAV
ncbi:MAG: HD domain-containing protein [Treponemataceae bacterium]|nr:HD domain-containing protein [Treponemataceae bacterium]